MTFIVINNIINMTSTVKVVEKKEMPTWISESTVRTAEDQVIIANMFLDANLQK